MAGTVLVLSPVGGIYTPPKPAAARPAALESLRPGVLENSKHNAQMVMEEMIEALRERAPLGPLTVGHKSIGLPPSRSTVELLRENCDFVLVGSSD